MTVKEAAATLGHTPQTIRTLMERNIINIGLVITYKKRKRYIIIPEQVEAEKQRRKKW